MNNNVSAAAGDPPLWQMFLVVAGLSALSWSGLALMAQLENHYVERKRLMTRLAFSDLMALAWMTPGPVGCNVAVQLGNALRGRAGAWVAGSASVLPFAAAMTLLALFYRTPAVHTLASHTMLDHFSVVLASLIGVTWFKQTRALIRGGLQWTAALAACVALDYAHVPGAYLAMLGGAFALGWFYDPQVRGDAAPPGPPPRLDVTRQERLLFAAMTALLLIFAAPLPHAWDRILLWPRLGGAGLTLFGGGFSAVPILKTVFVTPAIGVTDNEFTLAFTLSQLAPGPLLNVVPFLSYLVEGWPGAVLGTFALFVPSACLVVVLQRHLGALQQHPRFEAGMRLLRAVTTSFLAVAVIRLLQPLPPKPIFLVTAAFSLLAFGRLKLPVYLVYGIVFVACLAARQYT